MYLCHHDPYVTSIDRIAPHHQQPQPLPHLIHIYVSYLRRDIATNVRCTRITEQACGIMLSRCLWVLYLTTGQRLCTRSAEPNTDQNGPHTHWCAMPWSANLGTVKTPGHIILVIIVTIVATTTTSSMMWYTRSNNIINWFVWLFANMFVYL